VKVIYDGILPVPPEQITAWKQQGVERVIINYVNDLDILIEYSDMEECNNHMDEIVGVSLMDLSYGVAREESYDLWTKNAVGLDDGALVMFVEGEIDWSSYEEDE
jgi:hypothetical protein